MSEKLMEIAQRIKELQEIEELSDQQMAEAAGITVEEYLAYVSGENDFSFTFLYNMAKTLGVNLTDLMLGESPKLSTYCLVRKGEGMPIERRDGFKYQNMAYLFNNRFAEPFVVDVKYDESALKKPLKMSYHEGQEFDYILQGKLRMRIDNSEFVLCEGDSVYYDSGHGHGMAAYEGDCKILAIVFEHGDPRSNVFGEGAKRNG